MTNRLIAIFCLMLAACGPKPATEITPDPVTHPDVVANVADDQRELNPPKVPLVIRPMRGPFASIAAFCDTTEDRTCGPFGAQRDASRPVAAPFSDAVYLAVGVEGMRDCYLGVELDERWYFRQEAESCAYTDTRSMLEVIAASIYGESGASIVVVEYTADEMYANMDNDGRQFDDTYTAMVACGLGPSGTPSCTDSLVIRRSWQETALDQVPGDDIVDQGSWSLVVDFDRDVIVVTGESDSEEAADRVGDHSLVFP